MSLPQRVLPKPERRRRIPESFSWVDHRLVRDRYVQRCSPPALALYLVLITVADADGVSFYGDGTLCRMLRWPAWQLSSARHELEQSGLVAYQAPFYQVLSLEPETSPPSAAVTDRLSSKSASRPAPGGATPEEVRTLIAEWKRRCGCV